MKIAGTMCAAAVAALMAAGCGKTDASEGKPAVDTAKPAAEAAKAAAPEAKVDPKTVVVKVGDKTLTQGEIDADFELIVKARGGNLPPEQLAQAKKVFASQRARMFMDMTVLLDEADRKGVKFTEADRKAKADEIIAKYKDRPNGPKSLDDILKGHPFGRDRALKEFDDQMRIQKLVEAEVMSKVVVDAKEVDAEFKKAADAAAKAAKAALDAEADIKKIYAELKDLKGDVLTNRFAEIAKKRSACPSGRSGGDLGAFQRGQMVPEFDKVAFAMEPGKVSEPLKTQFGWHVLMVTKKFAEKKAEGDKPAEPEKVQASHILLKTDAPAPAPTREEVEKRMKAMKGQKAIMEYVENVRKAAKVEAPTMPEILPKPPPAPKAPVSVESKPVEAKPAAKVIESKPVEAKPAEAKK